VDATFTSRMYVMEPISDVGKFSNGDFTVIVVDVFVPSWCVRQSFSHQLYFCLLKKPLVELSLIACHVLLY
jgi:hypothetical protein